MRIVFLNPVGALGGAERVLLDLLAGLPELDARVDPVLVAGADGPLVEEARRLGVRSEVLALPKELASLGDSAARFGPHPPWRLAARVLHRAPALAGYATRLARVVQALRPDLVHSNGIKTHLVAALALAWRWPLLWHVHDFLGERPLVRRAARLLGGGARLAVANSEAVARDARRLLPHTRVAVVHNGVDTARFHPGPGTRADLDRLAGLGPAPEGTVRFGLVATYARWKGHDVFLRAFAQVTRACSVPMRAYVVGSPVYRTEASQFAPEELRGWVETLGLREQVGFVPFQQRPEDAFRAMDVVVHASTQPEPFGMTIVEGMASGRAVIVSRAGGAAELFRDGHDAVGTPPGDASALAEAMMRLARDAALRTRLGHAARQTVELRFARHHAAARMLGHYRELVAWSVP
ncbi:MAG: glycosyltransferase family 4 protein [Myxococcaceae bacterium]|nr:glycosyltransferase family 4 protein [Myxococcaceae bacterium]